LTPEQVFDTFGAMRSPEEYARVISLIAEGHNNSEISRMTGISRTTIREWRVGKGHRHRTGDADRAGLPCDGSCSGVAERAVAWPRIYAHLLGLYLGDGTISKQRRGVDRLRIFLDMKYPLIIESCVGSMSVIRGSTRIGLLDRIGCVEVGSSWKHWKCVFPQAGPGMKHTRPIRLESWQETIVDTHPDEFLRGLFESDGNRHINTVKRPVAGTTKTYHYSRYMFSNMSDDIRTMFTDACEALGVHWTRVNYKDVAVSRRDDVAFLDSFLGPKR
jgi:hypothetical protein